MKTIKTWAEYKKMRELNYKFLDTLDLPKPEFGEDLRDYVDRVESMFNDIELPLPYELNSIFEYADDQEELGKYLANRFGMNCMEDFTIKYIMY